MNRFYQGDWIDSMASRFIDELPSELIEKIYPLMKKKIKTMILILIKTLKMKNEQRSPGWARYQKRLK